MIIFEKEREKETVDNWLFWMENPSAGILMDFLRDEMCRYMQQACSTSDNVLADIRNTERSLASYKTIQSILDKIAQEMQDAKIS